MTSGNVIGAFSEENAERLTGVKKGQLRSWARSGLLRPSFAIAESRSPFSRIYSFHDLAALRVLHQLRNVNNVQPRELRAVAEALNHLGEAKWTQTTLYVAKGKVVFSEPGTGNLREVAGSQYVSGIVLGIVVDDLRAAILDLNKRGPDELGQTKRSKYVSRNALVFAGTRIPVKAVREYLDAGFSPDVILKEFPSLTVEDIEVAGAQEAADAA